MAASAIAAAVAPSVTPPPSHSPPPRPSPPPRARALGSRRDDDADLMQTTSNLKTEANRYKWSAKKLSLMVRRSSWVRSRGPDGAPRARAGVQGG